MSNCDRNCDRKQHKKKCCEKELVVYSTPQNNIKSCLYQGGMIIPLCGNAIAIVNVTSAGITLIMPQNACDGALVIIKPTLSPTTNFITILSGLAFIQDPATPTTIPSSTTTANFIGGISGEGYQFVYARAVNTWIISALTY